MTGETDTSIPLAEHLSLVQKVVGSAALGWVLGLSSAGFGVWWLAWCGTAPLLVLVRASKTWRESASCGVAFGFVYNLFTLSWIFGFHPAGLTPHIATTLGAVSLTVNALALALPYAGFTTLLYALPMRAGIFPDYRRPYFPYILSVPVAWMFFNYLAGQIIGLHINDLCYSQAGQLQIIQIARLGGGKLLSFLLILSNAALAQVFITAGRLVKPLEARTDRLLPATGSLVDLATVILSVVLCAMIGGGQSNSCLHSNVPAVSVSTCQANESDTVSAGGHDVADASGIYAAMVRQVDSALTVLPEGIVHDTENGATSNDVTTLVKALGTGIVPAGNQREIIAGCITRGHSNYLSIGRMLVGNKPLYLDMRVSYLIHLFELPRQLLKVVWPAGHNMLSGYLAIQPTTSVEVIDTYWGRVGICTGPAIVRPQLIKNEVRRGAGLLVCMADLSCFHSTILDRQILAAAAFRAVENGRYLILATNRGVSAIIDSCGKIVLRSLSGTCTTLTNHIQFLYRNTFFGDMHFDKRFG